MTQTQQVQTAASPPIIGISRSEMEDWARDPRKWYLTWYLQYRPAVEYPTGARNLGSRYHAAMQLHYGPEPIDALLVLDVLYAAEIEAHPDFADELEKDRELSKIMAEGWFEHAAAEGLDAHHRVVAVEQEMTVPLPGLPGYGIRVKLDQAVQNLDTGVLSFRDWKTGADFTAADYADQDPQMRLYSLAQWLASGQPPPGSGTEPDPSAFLVLGGIVTVAKKVKRTKTAKPPFYKQREFVHPPEVMAATLARVTTLCDEISVARYRLDQAGGDPDAVNHIQSTMLRRVWITRDCERFCPHSSGMCQLMDRGGTGWMQALVSGSGYVQGDPYDYYNDDPVSRVRALLEKRSG